MAGFRKIFIGINTIGFLLLYYVYINRSKTPTENYYRYTTENYYRNKTENYYRNNSENYYRNNSENYYRNKTENSKEVEEYALQIEEHPACQIPQFDEFHPTVRIFYRSPGKLKCSGPEKLVIAEKTRLSIDEKIHQKYYNGNARCTYKEIWREDDGKSDDKYGMAETGKIFTGSMKIMHEDYVYVECTDKNNGRTVYTEFFPFVQVKEKIETSSAQYFTRWVQESRDIIRERLNVVMVGADSISRLNMLRHMPKTYEYLRNEVGAVDLRGYNKVADNTFVNIVPLLSGLYLEECWDETKTKQSHNYLNLIWKDFKQRGYRTFYAEDAAPMNTFNYLKAGFFHQPTDYYARPLALAIEKSTMKKNSKENCFNSRSESGFYLDWLTDYMDTFRDKPHFAFLFNSRLTHDEINNAGYADEIYYNFFKKFHESGFNNNTVLIFFSDHGIRFGDIRSTYVGKIEERMPILMLMFPPWFKTEYRQLWKNLRINERRLTTTFDVYETLRDLINFTGEARQSDVDQRGISLFTEINPKRTCENAEILPHWCICRESKAVSISDPKVQKAASKVVATINNILAVEVKCSKLFLTKIMDARINDVSDKVLRFEKSSTDILAKTVSYGSAASRLSDYLLTLELTPGGGLFEGTVRYSESAGIYNVAGDISRINKYGNQSTCTASSKLRKFCYCDVEI